MGAAAPAPPKKKEREREREKKEREKKEKRYKERTDCKGKFNQSFFQEMIIKITTTISLPSHL